MVCKVCLALLAAVDSAAVEIRVVGETHSVCPLSLVLSLDIPLLLSEIRVRTRMRMMCEVLEDSTGER
jgi:uncharacterized protein YueI